MKRLLIMLALGLAWALNAYGLGEEEQRQFADGLYRRNMHEMALKEYGKLLQQYPQHVEKEVVWFRMAESARQQKQVQQAIGFYNQVILGPKAGEYKSRAFLRKAQMLVEAKRFDLAEGVLDEMLKGEKTPGMIAAALYYKGIAQKNLAQAQPAEGTFRKLVADHKDSPYASYGSMEIAQLIEARKGSAEEARKYYAQASQNPASAHIGAQALMLLGNSHFRQKEFEQSAEAFNRLLASYGTTAQARAARLSAAWANHNIEAYDPALRIVRGTPRSEQENQLADWWYLEANCLRQLGRGEEAQRVYEQVIARFDDSDYGSRSRYEAALIAYRAGKYQQAIGFADPLMARAGTTLDAMWVLAESYKGVKNHGQARAYFKVIAQKGGESSRAAEALFNMGQLSQKDGAFPEAETHFVALVERFPKHKLAPRSLFTAAFCATKQGKHPEAIAHWTRLSQAYPDSEYDDDSFYQRGLAQMGVEQHQAAIDSFTALRGKHTESPFRAEAAYWQATLLERIRPGEALKEREALYRETLAAKPSPELKTRGQYHLAVVLQQQGNLKEAADFVQSVISDPSFKEINPEVLEWAARYRLENKQAAPAAAAARSLGAGPFPPAYKQVGHALHGQALQLDGKEAEAVQAYHLAIKVDAQTRDGVDAALFLGRYQLERKQLADAKGLFGSAAEMASGLALLDLQAASYMGLADASRVGGEWDAASRYYMSVAVLFDDKDITPQALYRAAEAFGKSGKAGEKKKTLEELKERYPDSSWSKQAEQDAASVDAVPSLPGPKK